MFVFGGVQYWKVHKPLKKLGIIVLFSLIKVNREMKLTLMIKRLNIFFTSLTKDV